MFRRLEKPFALSRTSKKRLDTCNEKLQNIVKEVLYYMDVTVLEGNRCKEAQEEALRKGNSRACFGASPHNYYPSFAVDIAPYPIPMTVKNGKKVWDDNSPKWNELFCIFDMIAKQQGVAITWGGNFKTLVDKPHYEMTDWKKLITTPMLK